MSLTPQRVRGITIQDVARRAGVSKGTVSRHLNGKNWVRPTTAAAIAAAIEELKYVPNSSAQRLARQRTDFIGCVFSEPLLSLSDNPIFALLLQDVTRQLAARGRSSVLLFAQTKEEEERVLYYARSRHVDGLIIMTPRADSWLLKELATLEFPTVTTGPVSDDPDWPIPFCGVDDAMGSRQAIEHLRSLGRQTIGVISGPLRTPGSHARLQAAVAALPAVSDPRRIEIVPAFSSAAGFEGARSLLERCPDIDALYVASDVVATGAVNFISRSDRRIPRDIAVVGFDNVATDPSLTTVAAVEGGVSPADLISDLVDGKTVRSVLQPTTLMERASTTGR